MPEMVEIGIFAGIALAILGLAAWCGWQLAVRRERAERYRAEMKSQAKILGIAHEMDAMRMRLTRRL